MFQKSKDRLSTVAISHGTRTSPCFLRPSCLRQPLGMAGSRKRNPSLHPLQNLGILSGTSVVGCLTLLLEKKGAIGGWSRSRGRAGHSLVANDSHSHGR